MSRRYIPADWERDMSVYRRRAGQAAKHSADACDTSVTQAQNRRFADRLQKDRREMAAMLGREFLP